ncbi:hypothetical protein BASA81_001853 [Batrachochytrium salamandrivorans]|nr:hypothetical protein BASA81_001853 [Batrachochytrium salamandrivorans]
MLLEDETLTRLFNTRGGLSDCLSLCDTILSSPETPTTRPVVHFLALNYRAVILLFLGCDELAEKDIQLLLELYSKQYALISPQGDCPLSFVCSAADWHRTRRFAMLRRRPELKLLYNNLDGDVYRTILLLLVLVMSHLASLTVVSAQPLLALPLAVSVGAVCAFGFQALIHELSHMVFSHTNTLAFATATLAASFCNFPWHYYYFNYHNRHHAHTGGEKDRDGDILFRAWHCPPTISRGRGFFWNLGANKLCRWLWTGVFGLGIYFMFCRAKWLLDAKHEPSIKYEGPMMLTHLLVWYWFGWVGLFYLLASAGFSLGALGHPFIQFWLTQHAFVMQREVANSDLLHHAELFSAPLLQPTVSGRNDVWLWQAMNFGELRHMEHHDFPVISFWRAYQLPKLCPEFYSSLKQADYVTDFREWVESDYQSGFAWMKTRGDFAGRSFYLTKLWRLMMEEEENVDEPQVWDAADDVDEMSEPELEL